MAYISLGLQISEQVENSWMSQIALFVYTYLFIGNHNNKLFLGLIIIIVGLIIICKLWTCPPTTAKEINFISLAILLAWAGYHTTILVSVRVSVRQRES